MLVHPGSSLSMRSCSVSLVRVCAVSCVDVMLLSLSLLSELVAVAIDVMTLRLSMGGLGSPGSPKDRLMSSKISSDAVADGASGAVADEVLVDESEASASNELP